MTVLFDPAWQRGAGVNTANCELAAAGWWGAAGSGGRLLTPLQWGSALTWGAERGFHSARGPRLDTQGLI